jgi:ubiquinone/menaquinone biosynthesis C-methylase UbiE
MRDSLNNVDETVAAGFGHEWSTFQQDEGNFSASDREAMFHSYFRIFPWEALPPDPVGLDVGCGSGRWSVLVAPQVGHLHLLDASSDALAVARKNLSRASNTTFHLASVGDIPLQDGSLDFAFSLGVLHHVPDTLSAIKQVASKLKKGAPFLIYLYYALDNRPWWFRAIWKLSNIFRIVICRLPASLRLVISQLIAVAVYWPLARTAALVQRAGLPTALIPLEAYRNRSFYVMRTDAYDRFCTSLEKRFTRKQIEQMLRDAGFEEIRFSEQIPFWCAVGLLGARRRAGDVTQAF